METGKTLQDEMRSAAGSQSARAKPDRASLQEGLLQWADMHQDGVERPKYGRLKVFLTDEVTSGRLKPGTPLPSEKELGTLLQISRGTVRQALADLESDGLIRRVQGVGTFVSEQVQQGRAEGLDVFALIAPSRGFYSDMQRGFEAAASHVHKQVLVCANDNNLERQGNVVLQLVQKKVSGVALVPTSLPLTPAYQVKHLQQHGIPVVFCHRGVEGAKAPLLSIPFQEVGRMAGQLLVKHGHRRVAFFSMHEKSEASEGYECGLREALRANGTDLREELIYWGTTVSPDPSLQGDTVLRALEQMCGGKDPPTAIMASFDSLAELIYLLLDQLRLRVPEDISLIGFGGASRHGAITERLTSITIDEEDVGCRAAKLLQEMSSGQRPLYDTEKFDLPLGLAVGQTVGAAPLRTEAT